VIRSEVAKKHNMDGIGTPRAYAWIAARRSGAVLSLLWLRIEHRHAEPNPCRSYAPKP
jgi:hypothetical protein